MIPTERASEPRKQFFAHPLSLVETDDVGPGTRVWAFAHIMEGARVGSECNIGEHAFVETGAILGNNVTVKNGVAVWAGVTVEDNVFLGPNCVLTNDPNPRAYIKKSPASLARTQIQANATIGANATVLCGITIGQYAFIGAGAVVLRSVPDYALVVGNPGRQIGWMCICADRLPMSVLAAVGTVSTCVRCDRSFRRTEGGLTLAYQPEDGTNERFS